MNDDSNQIEICWDSNIRHADKFVLSLFDLFLRLPSWN